MLLGHLALASSAKFAGARAKAVHSGDVDAIVVDLADDVLSYDVVDPLRREGKASSRMRAAEWLASYDGPVSWENRDLEVGADGGVAFARALSRVTGKLKTGIAIDMWFRTTLGFRRIGGRWLTCTTTARCRLIRRAARRRSASNS